MASTRNKNTPEDYCLQQKSYKMSREHVEYKHSAFGSAYHNAQPCLGFNPTHMPMNALSYNPVDIESSLFGINANNLVKPQPKVDPQLKSLPMKSYFQRQEVIMPEKLVVSKTQRPFPIPE